MRLVIDTKKWYRGHGSDHSKLRRVDDGMQCCLGFYLRACGVKAADITDLTMPSSLSNLPKQAQWLKGKTQSNDSTICNKLAVVNDSKRLNETARRKRVKELFKKQGVTVVFKEGK